MTDNTKKQDSHEGQRIILDRYHATLAGNLQTRIPERMRDFLSALARHKYPSREHMLSLALNEFMIAFPRTAISEGTHPPLWQARAVNKDTSWVQFTVAVDAELAQKVRDHAQALNASTASYLASVLNWWARLPEQAQYFKTKTEGAH